MYCFRNKTTLEYLGSGFRHLSSKLILEQYKPLFRELELYINITNNGIAKGNPKPNGITNNTEL